MKDRIVSIRFTDREYQRLRTLADRAGSSMSEFVRSLIVRPTSAACDSAAVSTSALIWVTGGSGVETSGGTFTVNAS